MLGVILVGAFAIPFTVIVASAAVKADICST